MRNRNQREYLIEIILNRRIWTAFQPLVELPSGKVMGYEGLSRGPRGSDVESPAALFGMAARHGLTEELERACRRVHAALPELAHQLQRLSHDPNGDSAQRAGTAGAGPVPARDQPGAAAVA
jgi:EAL domain-containing protein (putative c-di-GMP-specific phosphodiesterase class I)